MQPQRSSLSQHLSASSEPPQTIDPRWIGKALLAMLALGVACAYVAICALFYVQQWQLVLSPSRTMTQNPSSLGLPYEEVHFAPDAAGVPQLDGWWIPGDTPSDPAALLLHGGTGNMSDALPLAKQLHDARLGVLLFDYRGYGRSAGKHPDQKTMQADAEQALSWLTNSGHAASGQLLVVGQGLGASLATGLCAAHSAAHSQISGLVLVDGDGDTAVRASRDTRSRLVPFRWLYHEDFPLADTLSTLRTPKLLVSHTAIAAPVDVQRAADPKMTYELGPAGSPEAMHEALRRFMDSYLTQAPDSLVPKQ